MPPPQLTFFCELDGSSLHDLFEDPGLIPCLKDLGARLSLGIVDFSDERARVVHRLNIAGIPVAGWQLLPLEEGYWYNQCNTRQAAARYAEFLDWTRDHRLEWDGVGLDIEPDIREFRALLGNKLSLPPQIFRRGCSKRQLRKAQRDFRLLIDRIHTDGYRIESYELPFMADERKAGSTLLQRLLGIVEVPADRRVAMLYTSFFPRIGVGFLWHYARGAGSVGVGLTGGGVKMPGIPYPAALNWDQFSRDLRIARLFSTHLHVYSLEGCVRQDFLRRLADFDWDRPVPRPRLAIALVAGLRAAFQLLLRASAHLFWTASILTALIAFGIWLSG